VQTIRIGVDEEIDDTKGLKPEEINERIQERESKAHAQILEMVSDIGTLLLITSCLLMPFAALLLYILIRAYYNFICICSKISDQ